MEKEDRSPPLLCMDDVYQLKLRQAQHLQSLWPEQKTLAMRDEIRTRAHQLERESGLIAHCIVRFGNLSMADLQIEVLRNQLSELTPTQFNPWRQGLAILSRHLSP